jgi:hypothetical protein
VIVATRVCGPDRAHLRSCLSFRCSQLLPKLFKLLQLFDEFPMCLAKRPAGNLTAITHKPCSSLEKECRKNGARQWAVSPALGHEDHATPIRRIEGEARFPIAKRARLLSEDHPAFCLTEAPLVPSKVASHGQTRSQQDFLDYGISEELSGRADVGFQARQHCCLIRSCAVVATGVQCRTSVSATPTGRFHNTGIARRAGETD